MRFDPNVYTTAASESWRPHWYISHPDFHEVRGVAPGESWGLARSIQPIPSAEEIAALVECEKALIEMLGIVRCDPTMDGSERPVGLVDVRRSVPVLRSARAALARLDAARNGEGK